MTFGPRSTLQEQTKGTKNIWTWPFAHGKGQAEKMCKNQAMVEFTKDTPPIFRSKRDAQHNLLRGEIPTHGREHEIINV